MKVNILSLIAFFLLLNFTQGKAQLVTINDPGFVDWLQANYPSCMTGNQLETSCAGIVDAGYISIPNTYTILDLDGLQYFTSMSTFICQNNSLTSIPTLPQTNLLSYRVANNNLTTIPNIPSSVTSLNISNNSFTSLPGLPNGLLEYRGANNPDLPLPTFPGSVTSIDISGNNLSSYPPFSDNMLELRIGGNPLATIPTLPTNLEILTIDNMNLTQLPALPNSLLTLGAPNNDFVVLNSFPPNITNIDLVFNTSLDSVYNLPNSTEIVYITNCGLEYIGNIPTSAHTVLLYDNDLTTLPTLPSVVSTLNISNNDITTIDYLPSSMELFNAFNNNISCMPIIPDVSGSVFLNLMNNPLTCVPNYTNDMNATLSNMPLCSANDPINNPMGCSSAEGISGYVYSDTDLSCTRTNNEMGIGNIPVRIYDAAMNQIAMTSSIENGRYFIPNSTAGTYTVFVDTSGVPVESFCPDPGVDSTLTLTVSDSLADNVDFGFVCAPGFDLGATSAVVDGWVFPGQNHTVSMNIGDISDYYNLNCAQGIAGTVTINIVGPVDYVTHIPGTITPTVNGSTFTYPINDFGMVDFNSDFGLEFETQTTAQTGDEVCIYIEITPTSGDYNNANNTFTYCYDVVNSYDPNDKIVYPKEVTSNEAFLYYTINFQNTGSAPAFNIRLEDTLSTQLDLTTFQVVDYSHDMHFNLDENNLTVHYPNIMLVDSTTNLEDSKGFIQFRVKPTDQFLAGDSIENKAYIFFDFNDPILTNTAKTIFLESTVDVNELVFNQNINVFPNPTKDQLNIRTEHAIKSLLVYDQVGRLMNVRATINNTGAVIDFNNESPGLINIHIVTSQGTAVKKVVVQ